MRENYHQRQGLIDLCNYIIKDSGRSDLLDWYMVEIGCYQGESSLIFAERFNKLACIDIWDDISDFLDDTTMQYPMSHVESNFDERLEGYTNVTKYKGDFQAMDYLSLTEFSMADVVYIDANHEYLSVFNDIIKVLSDFKHIKYICGHDYTEGWPGVIKAVDNLLGKPVKTFQDGSWIVKMPKIKK